MAIKRFVFQVLSVLFLSTFTLVGAQEPSEDQVTAGEDQTSTLTATTRAGRLQQKREQKRQQLSPPEQGIAEKFLKKFDQKGNQSIEDVNFQGFHPRIDWIARGSGVAAGVRYWNPDLVGPLDLMGSAFVSRKLYKHYDFQFGLIPHRGKKIPSKSFATEEVEQLGDVDRELYSRFKLYGSVRYRDRADEAYFGPGADSQRDDKSYYRVKDTLAEVVTGFQLTSRIGWTVKAGVLNHTLRPGRSSPILQEGAPLPLLEIPGLAEPPNYFRYHNSFLFDYRDDPGNPHSGLMVAFGWEWFDNVNTVNQFNFHRFGLDTRAYVPLGSHQRVLALRGVFVDSDPAEGDLIPFFLQPSLGGGESLRAYEAYRFQGDKMMLIQAEYRWEPSRRFEMAIFGDTGTVANQGNRISLDELKSDWGVGFRFKSSRSTLFRVDQAFGNEGPRTQFRFSAVF